MKKNKNIFFILFVIFFEIISYLLEPILNKISIYIGIPILIIITTLFYILYEKNGRDKKIIYYYLILLGMIFRNIYIMKTSIYERGHDIDELYNHGHLGYIYTIYKTGALPLTNNYQFYHPPLFHILGAIFLKFNDLIGLSLERGIEGLQYLNGIFATISIIIWFKIINELKIRNEFYIKLLICFYPSLFLLSGSINNDCLLVMLESLIILLLIKWNNKDDIKNTCILAIVTGLTVMTKLNGALMAVPILYVFLRKLYISIYKEKGQEKKVYEYINKYVIFGIISLPIGLWFQVRNILKFSSNGIPTPGDGLSVANYSFLKRFVDFSFSDIFDKIFCNIDTNDYNVFAYIVKSSIFGEYKYDVSNTISIIFLIVNVILILVSLLAIIKKILEIFNKKEDFISNILLITWIVSIIGYILFNIKYPYFCTLDFRYIILTSFIGIIYLFYKNKYIENKIINKVIKCLSIIFTIISSLYYTILIF